MRMLAVGFMIALALGACANKRTTDIDVEDASQAQKVKFGTVLDSRQVSIHSDPSGATSGGALLGGAAGAVIGQTTVATFGGLLVGALAGSRLHAFMENGNGVEYTIALADGHTVLVAQLQESDERVFKAGDAVLVQYGATVNRVLSAERLPGTVAKPRGVTVAGATGEKIDSKSCDKATVGRSQREVCTQH